MNSAPSPRISFVVPVATEGTGKDRGDLERLSLLLDTFLAFFDLRGLGDFLIVTRAQDVPAVSDLVKSKEMSHLVRVLNENEIVPELKLDPATYFYWPKPNKGWYRQQLIKLACHAHVNTEFYMTLDADVAFVKPFDVATLVRDGRAIVNIQNRRDARKLFRPSTADGFMEVRTERYQVAEQLL